MVSGGRRPQHPTEPRMVPNKGNLAPGISSAEKPYVTRN